MFCSAARARSSRPLLERVPGLGVALVDLLLQRVHLEFNPLARGGHVRDPALDPGQHLDLLLVRIVEGLAWVFHPVQRLVGLGPEYQRDSLHHAHRRGRPLHLTMRRLGGTAPPGDGYLPPAHRNQPYALPRVVATYPPLYPRSATGQIGRPGDWLRSAADKTATKLALCSDATAPGRRTARPRARKVRRARRPRTPRPRDKPAAQAAKGRPTPKRSTAEASRYRTVTGSTTSGRGPTKPADPKRKLTPDEKTKARSDRNRQLQADARRRGVGARPA